MVLSFCSGQLPTTAQIISRLARRSSVEIERVLQRL